MRWLGAGNAGILRHVLKTEADAGVDQGTLVLAATLCDRPISEEESGISLLDLQSKPYCRMRQSCELGARRLRREHEKLRTEPV